MGETGKTVTYIGVALLLGVVALLARPKQEVLRGPDIIGKPLFPELTDPTKAANFAVVRYAEDVGEVHNFEVAKSPNSGLWSIPSHGNYPADAQDQMKEAATALVDLTVLGVASENPQDHELYGVVEPHKERLKLGDKGVGLLVSLQDDKGGGLGRLVIGQKVKGTEDQRFVRIPGQDPVYVVTIDPDKLSTKFEDWIEKDLLKISTYDVERLRLKDYSVLPTTRGPVLQPRSEISVTYDSADAKWKLDEFGTYKGNKLEKSDLLEGEELNKEKLDEVKNSLNDVKIVDVFAKPKGLGASLKATGAFADDREAQLSLQTRGFYLDQSNELYSANGELHVLMKEGVEYVLRFGNVAGEQQDSSEGKLNRYLFVTARVDETKFPEPQLEDLPGEAAADPVLPAPDSPAKSAPAEGAPAKGAPAKGAPAKGASANGAPAEGASAAEPAASGASSTAGSAAPEKPAQVNPATTDEAAIDCQDNSANPVSADATQPAAEPARPVDAAAIPGAQSPPEQPAAQQPAPGQPSEAGAGEEELRKKKLAADRERVTRENQRKLDDWKNKKQAAEQKVRELNGRFADWYYVISEDVYKKLHLSRSDIIKEGAKAVEEGTGVDAFRKLEQDGLLKKE